MDNNPNLKCYPMLINSNTLCNNSSLPLILNNNSNHKIFIHNDIIIGTCERINNNNYITKITFNTNDKPPHVTTSGIPIQNDHINKINFDSNKPQDITTLGTHIPNNHTIKTNFSDKMQNVTNLNTTM